MLRFILLFIFTMSMMLFAHAKPEQDSLKVKKSPGHWRLTARIHSQALFNFGGRIATTNPAVDINFIYEKNNWGLFIFKGMDLYDRKTQYNFALISVYRNFKISKKITFTPYVGSFLEQENTFANKGSDLAAILITTARLNKYWSIEQMSLFANLIVEPAERDWVNRFRLTYAGKHWDVISSCWWNNRVFDSSNYNTAGLQVAYSRIKVADHFFLSAGVTGLWMIETSHPEINEKRSSVLFTVAASIVH